MTERNPYMPKPTDVLVWVDKKTFNPKKMKMFEACPQYRCWTNCGNFGGDAAATLQKMVKLSKSVEEPL